MTGLHRGPGQTSPRAVPARSPAGLDFSLLSAAHARARNRRATDAVLLACAALVADTDIDALAPR